MERFFDGNFIRLRLFKEKDRNLFFIKNGYYQVMLKGHLEYEPLTSNFNFETYFRKNNIMHFDSNFTLIIANIANDYPIGIIEVFDTSSRNGVYFVGIYIEPRFEVKEYYQEAIIKIKDFMFNELRYQSGFIIMDSNQQRLINLVKELGYQQCGLIHKRYYQKLDQLLFMIEK